MVSQYVALLQSALKQSKLFFCTYCGAETPAVGGMCMCSNCESFVYMDRALAESKDSSLVGLLQSISEKVKNLDYDGAIAAYDTIIASNKDPNYFYAKSLIYIKYSNHVISQIRYDRDGFMEENTALRDRGAALMLTAKSLLNWAVYNAMPDMKDDKLSLNAAYMAFLAYIKLSDLKAAQHMLQKVKVFDSNYVGRYADVVLESNTESQTREEKLLAKAEALTSAKCFSINAFYYIALCLYDKRNYKECRELATHLKEVMSNSSIDYLIRKSDEQLSI